MTLMDEDTKDILAILFLLAIGALLYYAST